MAESISRTVADDESLRRLLAEAGPSRPLDFRWKTIEGDLFGRMLTLAPRDSEGRPVLRSARFAHATFLGNASFDGVVFKDDVSFDHAAFKGDASFVGAVFTGSVRFGNATFDGRATFASARLEGSTWFSCAAIAGDVDFSGARFGAPVWFSLTSFGGSTDFAGACFAAAAVFERARFGGRISFAQAVFEREADLEFASFEQPPRYDGALFRGPGGGPRDAARQTTWAGSPLASWRSRAMASLIDHVVPAVLVAAVFLLPLLLDLVLLSVPSPLLLVVAVVGSIAFTLRNLVTQGRTGQTLGKRVMGLSLVHKADGQPVGVRVSLLRYLLHVVDTLPAFLGWLAPLRDPNQQTFSDRLTTTVVVQEKGWAGSASPMTRPGQPPTELLIF